MQDLLVKLKAEDLADAKVANNDLIKGLSPKTALALIRKAGYESFNELIKRGEPFRSTALNISALAQEAAFSELTDEAAIRALVSELLGEDAAKSAAAFAALKGTIGEFGVPYLLEAWNTAGSGKARATIQIALTEIGRRAVPPMVAALDTPDVTLKGMLISVLGGAKDWRAAAKLRAIAADANMSEEMRNSAMKACAKIVSENTGLNAEKLSASELYGMLAEDYLAGRTSAKRNVVPRYELSDAARFHMWSFENGALADAAAPRFAYNYEMAIECAARGLALDANNGQAASVLVCARLAEIPAGQFLLDYDAARREQNAPALTDVERAAISETLAKAQAKGPAAVALGLRALCGGLDLALKYGLDQAAISCLTNIASLPEAKSAAFLPEKAENQESAYGYAVIKAMWVGARQVRYRAAITLATIAPSRQFARKELVADLLLKAMEETAALRVLVAHPDAEARNALGLNLKALGYDVMMAQDSAEGLARAMDFPAPDVVIAYNELDRTTNFFIVTLRDSLTTSQMPILVVSTPEALANDKMRFENLGGVKGFITDITDRAALGGLMSAFKNTSTWQARENEAILKEAADIIGATMEINLTTYTERLIALAQSEKALEARVAAMKALGNMRTEAALGPAGVLLANPSGPKDLRAASALAIGTILSSAESVSEETLGILLTALKSPDPEVSRAAGIALASAPLTAEQRAKIPTR